MRMILTGTPANNIVFGSGSGNGVACTTGENCIFAPEGGGFKYQKTPEVFGFGGGWVHVGGTNSYSGSVSGVGTAADDIFIRDWAGGVPLPVCEQINKGLGIVYNPININSDSNMLDMDAYPGEKVACVRRSAGFGPDRYYYYHVIVAL